MDDELDKNDSGQNMGENNPYRQNMQTAQDEVRPEFLNGADGKKRGQKERKAKTGGAAESLKAAESEAGGSFYNNGKGSARDGEENPRGLYKGVSNGKKKFKKPGKFSIAKASVGIVIFFVVLLFGGIVVLGTPIVHVGGFDFNLMDSVGLLDRIGILNEVATFVVGAELEKGEVSDQLAGNLAGQGLMVGQVTASGDFVRTNVYVADAENLKDLAVLGNYQANPSKGELAVLFDNEVVTAGDFVATLESDPKMYMAFLDATDIGTAYWYSQEMDEQLDQIGVKNIRSAFSNWQSTGDVEEDREKYEELKEKLLNGESNLTISGVLGTDSDGDGNVDGADTPTAAVSGMGDAGEIISEVADKMEDGTQGGANAKAAQSLNAVISAGEPYIAAKYAMFAESIMQGARISGVGPINEFMDDAYKDRKVSYVDALSTKTVETNESILSSATMQATIGGAKFSDSEAASLSRDRGVITMNTKGASVGGDVIEGTVISTDGEKKSDILTGISAGEKASTDELEVLSDGIDKAIVQSGSEQFTGVTGGVRIPGGLEFILNTVDSHLIAALASDDQTMAAYHREAEKMVARRAEAERATKSPFDISSPYTFMGSLTRNLATTVMKGRVSGGDSGLAVGVVANMAEDSAKGLYNTVVADGDDGSYEMATGDYCETASVVGASSSVLCGAKYTLVTKYMNVTDEEFENELKSDGNMDEDGEIVEKSDLGRFIATGMSRQSTVGIKDAEVCKRYKELDGDLWRDFLDALAGLFGQYQACDGREDVGTGANYTLNDSNSNKQDLEYYAAYVMRDKVKSLLDGGTSKVAEFREKYYAEHPLDNSKEGIIARRSGLTKQEVKVALEYADYLTFIAQYDPATRYAFGGGLQYEKPVDTLVEHASQVAVELYVMWYGQTEYDDLRGRTQVV